MQVNIIKKANSWLANHYGSRRGYVKTVKYQIYGYLGAYKDCKKVNWQSIDRLIFVCKGNICRSAYAEAIADSLGVDAISCGVDTRNDFPANDAAISVASARGISLSQHRTSTMQTVVKRSGDLFVAMEPWQLERVIKEYGGDCNCTLLGLSGSPKYPHIQDPYGATTEYFNHCFNYIEKSVHEIAGKISKT